MTTRESSTSPSKSSESSFSRSGDEGQLADEQYWRERCQSLEASLVKFKLQAAKIRDLLAEKLQEHESRTAEAEERAKNAEETVRILEERMGTQSPTNIPPLNHQRLEQILKGYEKQEAELKELRAQLHDQKSRRLHEAKLVEEKSMRIKEWVTQRIKKLEEEKDMMTSENDSLRDQVDSLRERFQAMPITLSTQGSIESRSSTCTPPIPQRPPSSILEAFGSPINDLSPDLDMSEDPDFQEVDEDRESKYAPKRAPGPPQVRIERRVFPNPRLLNTSSVVSSTAGSEETLNHSEGNLVLCKAPALTIPAKQSPQKSPSTPPSPYPPPNTPSCPLTSTDHTVSAIATLPRHGKKEPKFFPSSSTDYASLTIDKRLRKGERSPCDPRRARATPPTPPIRRMPSWENRIYAIANKGIRLPDTQSCIKRDSGCPVTNDLYCDKVCKTEAVPVYTHLNGRAAQIRSTPFSGDEESESESSDGEASTATGSTATATVTQTQTSSGAIKRGVSSHSVTSEASSDYAFPPDDNVSLTSEDGSDFSEPEHKLLKCSPHHKHPRKDGTEKCGYLTKLGGKVKNWRRRWFVLKNGELFYYKSPQDVSGKPIGHITLNEHTQVSKNTAAFTFEVVSCKKVYYLTADSADDAEKWIKVLQNVQKRQAADQMLVQGHEKEAIKGWLVKTHHGRSRRCYCTLVGKMFMYYRRPSDKSPLGQIALKGVKVEEVDRSCDSESDSDSTCIPDYTIAISSASTAPTYLLIPSKQEKDGWLYHLTVASGGGSGKVGTETEQLISKLMETEGDPSCVYWKYPVLLHTKEPLSHPLTTLSTDELQQKALKMFKSCHAFTNKAIESPLIDDHVTMARTILTECLQYSELQNELFCQLIKQTSRHPNQQRTGVQQLLLCGGGPNSWFVCDTSPTSPTNSVADLTESKLNPNTRVILQAWQLMALAVSIFLPKQSVLWFLKAHLHRHADPRNEVGKYAIFCQRALERTMKNGGRESEPSRMEAMSILLRNPFHHSQPLSIPVHFLNNTYQVISFDGSTTVDEFNASLNKTIGTRHISLSGFALFTDDPTDKELKHCLQGHFKLCDVIAKWEKAHLKHVQQKTDRSVKITFKNRLYFKSLAKSETERERLLLVFQTNEEIIHGRFPLNRDLAVELASLIAQIEHGDFRSPGEFTLTHRRTSSGRTTPPHTQQQITSVIERFYPQRFRDVSQDEMRFVEDVITEKWVALRGKTLQECVRIYLTVVRTWPYFGAKLFTAIAKKSSSKVWIAIEEEGISVLDHNNFRPVTTYKYKQVITFGGWKDDLMIVVSQNYGGKQGGKTEHLLFGLSKQKILEATTLISCFINIRQQRKTFKNARMDSAGSMSDVERKTPDKMKLKFIHSMEV